MKEIEIKEDHTIPSYGGIWKSQMEYLNLLRYNDREENNENVSWYHHESFMNNYIIRKKMPKLESQLHRPPNCIVSITLKGLWILWLYEKGLLGQ
jgi:hypothetical protein